MGQLVPRLATPLAAPGDHDGFVRALSRILREHLPSDLNTEAVRIRLVAHASLACGWNTATTWHFNYWGVRKGGWAGDWYAAAGPEVIDGKDVTIPEASSLWRAFRNPAEAVADTVDRLRRQPDALSAALDPSPEADGLYADARQRHGYWTARPEEMRAAVVSRCKRVRILLRSIEMEPDEDGRAPLPLLPWIAIGAAVLGILLLALAVR